MRVSFRWLREYLPKLDASPQEVADRLSVSGLEVEEIHHEGTGLESVVVSEVTKVEAHPNRDKLSLVTVLREGGQTQVVVCGANNVPAPGGLVVLAPLGTTLPAIGITLTPKKLGGIVSEGMLCSETELGLAEESDGIIVLAPGTAVAGTPVTEACPEICDTLFEIGVTPNRPDALGHIGVARDIAAMFDTPLVVPEAVPAQKSHSEKCADVISIANDDTERCPHYGAALVRNLKIGPSPDWMRWRLNRLGIRPISNVVDVTNWLLLEYGQPMHAFDLADVADNKIIIRRASDKEAFTTLDGVKRELQEDDLVICDGKSPVALAGVMGGENSEIKENTTDVLLECAYFMPRGVRRTSRRYALQTESSYRFERGTNWAGVSEVLERAKSLLAELAGGQPCPDSLHVKGKLPESPKVRLRSQRLNSVLGLEVDFARARKILQSLGLEVSDGDSDDSIVVTAAPWRPDISREEDLIEEVARVIGLDEIPTALPRIAPQPPRSTGLLEREMGELAESIGLSEAVTYSFVSAADLEKVHAPKPVVTLQNPLTEERSVMRTSHLPGLIEVLRRARRRGEASVRVFTMGSLILPGGQKQSEAGAAARPAIAGDEVLPEERPSFAAILAGPRDGYLSRPQEMDIFDAKGFALELSSRFLRTEPTVVAASEPVPYLHPRGCAELRVDGELIGRFGPLHPDVVDATELGSPALIVELDLAAMERLGTQAPKFQAFARLPSVSRDISLMVHEDVPSGDVRDAIAEAAGELAESVELFDVFRDKSVPADHRSLAFRVVYRDPLATTAPEKARTLTDKEVDKNHDRVRRATEKLGASLRE
ncbi:MAG: phenylalanine--tRNA ligase subunit beta [Polyangiaceae bacterium]|nr:phenylalanine--tRNA ligase subunit beta [Polyangiaceae bacterium]